jgi:hypothetical protein
MDVLQAISLGSGERIPLADDHEVARPGFFDLRFAAQGETQALTAALIDSDGWLEVQVVDMETQ